MDDQAEPADAPEVSCNGCTHFFTAIKPKLEELSKTIIEKIKEGKSVTKANKQHIVASAVEIHQLAQHVTASSTIRSNTSAVRDYQSVHPEFSGLNSLLGNMRKEIADIKKIISLSANKDVISTPVSYSDAVRGVPATAPARASSMPALIVNSSVEGQSKESLIKLWRQNISFRSLTFLPTKVVPVSHNKLRVEFSNAEERDTILDMVNASNSELSAEVARQLRPMVIVKGINKEVPVEQLLSTIKHQNTLLTNALDDENHMVLKFIRKNKKEHLYNAVFVIAPHLWNIFRNLNRLNIDHQKVHIEEFIPFIQCYKCMQFGHTRNRCSSALVACSHCGGTDHTYSECAIRHDLGGLRCFNCKNNNLRHNAHRDTRHSATSHTCPIVQTMKMRIMQRIDYNG